MKSKPRSCNNLSIITLALPLINASVTRSPALMMDTVAQNMEASAMRHDPPQTIMILDTCATSNPTIQTHL